jgi:hypothetical protein
VAPTPPNQQLLFQNEIGSTMAELWEECRNELCRKIKNGFGLQRFENRDYPIITLKVVLALRFLKIKEKKDILH